MFDLDLAGESRIESGTRWATLQEVSEVRCTPHLWEDEPDGDDRERLLRGIVEHGLGTLRSWRLEVPRSRDRPLLQIGPLTWSLPSVGETYLLEPAKECDPRGLRVRHLELRDGKLILPEERAYMTNREATVQLPPAPVQRIRELISHQTGDFDTRGVIGWVFEVEEGEEVWLISENPFGLYFDLMVPVMAGDVPEWVREDYESKLVFDARS